jgi:hypothetical protein
MMRYVVFALMLVLLPLRGWMGDVMAIGMAGAPHTSAGAAPQSHAAHGEHGVAAELELEAHVHAAAAMQHDCPEHAVALSDGPQADCTTCAFCQICHSPALSEIAVLASAHVLASFAPAAIAAHFASADPAQGQKPPIS